MSSRTNDNLLAKIKLKAFIPTSQNTFTDEELLQIATDELYGVIVPSILDTREEYFVYKDSSSVLSGQNPTYNIPHRAIGMQLREISVTTGNTERNVPRLDIEDRYNQDVGGYVYGFDITNNQINVRGSSSGTLNMYYYLRPGALVPTSNARAISAVDVANKQVTVSSFPATWTTSTRFDIIKHKPGYDAKTIELTVANLDPVLNVVTFNEDLPAEAWRAIEVNDWLVEAEKSPVPQIPLEWEEYLAEAVACYIMESIGDAEAFVRAEKRKEELKKSALSVISSRVDGQSKKQVPRRNRINAIYDSKYRNY